MYVLNWIGLSARLDYTNGIKTSAELEMKQSILELCRSLTHIIHLSLSTLNRSFAQPIETAK
jgi:hypothetical protein